MSDQQPPILPLPSIKSPRPFSFANDAYIPADPSRFTHFMPSPISTARPDLRRPSASPAGSTSYKRSFLDEDTASPEAGSSHDDSTLGVKEEEEDEDDKTASGRALKQTKRAAQNRAAQQAFRKRKEERIRELESKEKILNKYLEREQLLARREQELLEREQLSALRALKSEASSNGGGLHYAESSQAPYVVDPQIARSAEIPVMPRSHSQHFQQQQQQQQQQDDSSLREARKMSLSLQLDLQEVKRQLEHKDSLLEALRRSLEDLGGENRSLRILINQQGGEAPPPVETHLPIPM